MSAATMDNSVHLHADNVEGSVRIPSWASLVFAGEFLAVSPLHIRLLIRDNVLRSRVEADNIKVSMADLISYRQKSQLAQEDFASDVARVEELRARIIDMCA